MRDSVDVYVDGQLRAARGAVAHQGSDIRITGNNIAPIRYQQTRLIKDTGGTLAFEAWNPDTNKKVTIVALSAKDCGCGKK